MVYNVKLDLQLFLHLIGLFYEAAIQSKFMWTLIEVKLNWSIISTSIWGLSATLITIKWCSMHNYCFKYPHRCCCPIISRPDVIHWEKLTSDSHLEFIFFFCERFFPYRKSVIWAAWYYRRLPGYCHSNEDNVHDTTFSFQLTSYPFHSMCCFIIGSIRHCMLLMQTRTAHRIPGLSNLLGLNEPEIHFMLRLFHLHLQLNLALDQDQCLFFPLNIVPVQRADFFEALWSGLFDLCLYFDFPKRHAFDLS